MPGHIQLRHQLIADDGEHLLQLVHVLFREALAHPLDHGAQVGVADVVVVDILLGGAQVVLAPVHGGLDLFHIALFDQTADLVGRIGGGDLHHAGDGMGTDLLYHFDNAQIEVKELDEGIDIMVIVGSADKELINTRQY